MRRSTGFSLVALMIAAALGTMLVSGVVSALISLSKTIRYTQNINNLVTESIIATRKVREVLEPAGNHYTRSEVIDMWKMPSGRASSDYTEDMSNSNVGFFYETAANGATAGFRFHSNSNTQVRGCAGDPATLPSDDWEGWSTLWATNRQLYCWMDSHSSVVIASGPDTLRFRYGIDTSGFGVAIVSGSIVAKQTTTKVYLPWSSMRPGNIPAIRSVIVAMVMKSREEILENSQGTFYVFDETMSYSDRYYREVVYVHVNLPHAPTFRIGNQIPPSDFDTPVNVSGNTWRWTLQNLKKHRHALGFHLGGGYAGSGDQFQIQFFDGTDEIMHFGRNNLSEDLWAGGMCFNGTYLDMHNTHNISSFNANNILWYEWKAL